jgi:membrane protease YdiL (CAAX protease family)
MSSTIYRISVFFAFAYAFTWGGIVGNWVWPSELWLQPMNPLGPLMAAPLAIWLTGGVGGLKAWGRRLINFRAPLWVYAAALLGPLFVIMASVGLAGASGAAIRPLPELGLLDFILAIPLVLVLGGPAGEELAFRGYAQQELQKAVTPLTAALLIGGGVVIWHAPLLALGNLGWPMAVCIVAVSIVYAWLYRAGGSVWPVVVLHFSVNYFGPEYIGSMVAEPEGQFIYQLFFLGFYLIWAGLIVWRSGPSLAGHRPLVVRTV